MAKQFRGKVLARLASNGRGVCPVCYATGTKLLYQRKKNDGTSVSVCKKCTDVTNETLNAIQPLPKPLAYRRKHRKTFNQLVHQLKQKRA